jgi:hypothetical protein
VSLTLRKQQEERSASSILRHKKANAISVNLKSLNIMSSSKPNIKRSIKAGKKKDTSDNVPVFLKKTYLMIDTCDATIATWSDDGLSFVVKDTEKFASQIICQFFKHKNFSSFVRQLNVSCDISTTSASPSTFSFFDTTVRILSTFSE